MTWSRRANFEIGSELAAISAPMAGVVRACLCRAINMGVALGERRRLPTPFPCHHGPVRQLLDQTCLDLAGKE
ncbi:MAG TPA: hypothetical protein PLB97_09105 [Accumulibacter sp.]|nr:hypothetical protein [Accumulibacter sp.]